MDVNIPEAFGFLFEPARYKGAHGGRGSAKSHSFARALLLKGGQAPLRVLCGREVQRSIKDSVKQLLDDKIADLGMKGFYDSFQNEIRGANGTSFIFAGLGNLTIDQIKSFEGVDILWAEEAQTLSKNSLEILRPTIRKPNSELWFSWNPRNPSDPVDMLLRGETLPPGAVVKKVNYDDNPFFPAELEAERAFDRINNPGRYAHIWLGEYEPQAIGAIWDRQTLLQGRRSEMPDMERIVVGVDPAVSSETGANEHGIIVAGLGEDKRGYVLDDTTTTGSPQKWATRAIATYDRWDADAIIIEINQGGDMVRHTLESIRADIRIIEVRATRGKHVRAEPISALYSLGRISHVGTFPELENDMCLMTAGGYEGEGSPDRCLIAGTMIETARGSVPIENIVPGDMALTRVGYRCVLASERTGKSMPVFLASTSDGRTVTGTGNHPVFVEGKGFLRLDALARDDILATCEKRQSHSRAGNTPAIQTPRTGQFASISTMWSMGGAARAAGRFIGISGSIITDQFLRGTLSTIWTIIRLTMIQTILNASLTPSMPNVIRRPTRTQKPEWTTLAPSQMCGMVAKRASRFTGNLARLVGLTGSPSPAFAMNAVTSMKRFPAMATSGSATEPAGPGGGRKTGPTAKSEYAAAVANRLWPKDRRGNAAVPVSVVGLSDAGTADVYNITVDQENEYFANGILVHNCDAMVWAFTELFPKLVTKKEIDMKAIDPTRRRRSSGDLGYMRN